jgi:hypothetical protein
MKERERALALARKILDRPNGDPDDDLATLSRQLLQSHEWRFVAAFPPPLGRNVLLWAITSVEPPNWRMASGYRFRDFDGELMWEWEGRCLKPYETCPTHWQPLPEPPSRAIDR